MLELTDVLTGDDPVQDFLVEGLYYTGQILIVAGEPGVGKSFLQYHIAMALAANRTPILGGKAKPGVKTLYFDEENSRMDLHQYLRWIWRGLDKPSIDLLRENLFIEHFALAKAGSKRFEYMARIASTIKPHLIIIDTVTPVCAIEDENDNSEASRALRSLRTVKEAAGPATTMILLKHAKFTHDPEQKQTIRGAKAWLGETDGTIYHKLVQGKPRQDGLRNSKLENGKVRAFGLRDEILIMPSWIGEDKSKGVRIV